MGYGARISTTSPTLPLPSLHSLHPGRAEIFGRRPIFPAAEKKKDRHEERKKNMSGVYSCSLCRGIRKKKISLITRRLFFHIIKKTARLTCDFHRRGRDRSVGGGKQLEWCDTVFLPIVYIKGWKYQRAKFRKTKRDLACFPCVRSPKSASKGMGGMYKKRS